MAEHVRQTAADTVRRVADGTDPWVAFGDFLDDWYGAPPERLPALCADPPDADALKGDARRWASLVAAATDWLCRRDGLETPAWALEPGWRLAEPWFLYPGWRLRAWQLVDTPAALKARNIYGGDRVFCRV